MAADTANDEMAVAEAERLGSEVVRLYGEGKFDAALPLAKRALAGFENALGPEHPHVATALNNLAALYKAKGDYGETERIHLRALAIREKALGPEHPGVAYSLNNLATVYSARGDYGKAEPLYIRTLAIWSKTLGPEHPYMVSALNNLALLYQWKGDYGRALPIYQHVLSMGSLALGPEHPYVAHSLGNLTWLSVAQGEIFKAAQTLRQAAAIEDRNAVIILTTGSSEQKRDYMATLRGSTDGAVSLHVQFAPNAQYATELAVTTILRRKGLVLDAMTDGFAAMRRYGAPADQLLLDELRSVSTQYSALVWGGPAKMPLERYRAMVSDLDTKRQDIEGRLSRRGAELQAKLRPVSIEQVQAAMPEGAALVELFRYRPINPKARNAADSLGNARYVAYVLYRTGEIAWTDLGEAEPIDAAVGQLRRVLARTAPDIRHADARSGARDLDAPPESATDPRPAARDLDRLVMQPIRGLLGSTRQILLSPDGALNLVPFGALVDEQGRYLVERYTFTYLTSGRDLVRLATHEPPRQGPVVVAAPDYNAEVARDEGSARASADARKLRFHPLQFAAEEGRAVAQKLDTGPLMGAEATESAVKQVKGPQVLHISTHGFFLPNAPERPAPREQQGGGMNSVNAFAPLRIPTENPLLRSGMALAGANRSDSEYDDGLLTALEVSQLDLIGTKLMVLSACETGVGEVVFGDGVYGLRRAMVMAGAETQVMSLWSVDDAGTCELMKAYYDKLLGGGGRSEALRQTQLEMLARPGSAHPYYWASFIVSGNPAALDGPPMAAPRG